MNIKAYLTVSLFVIKVTTSEVVSDTVNFIFETHFEQFDPTECIIFDILKHQEFEIPSLKFNSYPNDSKTIKTINFVPNVHFSLYL